MDNLVENPVFLAGASRGVGRAIALWLRERSIPVIALLRPNPAANPAAELEALGIAVRWGDAMDASAVEAALLAQPVTTVISTLGGVGADGQRVDFPGNRHLIDAAVKAGVQRFILVSSIGSGNSAGALPPHVLEALRPALIEKDQAEQYLMASGLTYTVIRPGGLKSEPATGQGVLTPDSTVSGSIHRADVALLIGQCLQSDRANNRVLSAIDRQQAYGRTDFEVLSA